MRGYCAQNISFRGALSAQRKKERLGTAPNRVRRRKVATAMVRGADLLQPFAQRQFLDFAPRTLRALRLRLREHSADHRHLELDAAAEMVPTLLRWRLTNNSSSTVTTAPKSTCASSVQSAGQRHRNSHRRRAQNKNFVANATPSNECCVMN